MTLSGRLAPNVWKPYGSASVTTTISGVWTPTTGKQVRLMGFDLTLATPTQIQVDIVEGTAAAAGTLSTHYFGTQDPNIHFSYGAGKLLSANTRPGIKARAGAGTISGTFYGREDTPA